MPKFTDAAVQRFKAPPGERVDHFDAALPGFALRVAGPTPRNPAGRKTWVLFYRVNGKQKRATIGSYPSLPLADARAAAILIKGGKMPPSAAEAPAVDTVADIVEQFMERYMRHGPRAHAPSYIKHTQQTFDLHVLPRWGNRPIAEITRRDVNRLLDEVADSGRPIAANRTLAALSKLFSWSANRDFVQASPVVGVEKRGAETPRTRVLTDDELVAIWNAAVAAGYPFGRFTRLLLLSGQRRTEVATIRWDDIETEKRVWTIPGGMTKSGRSQLVPLPDLALRIVNECPCVENCPFVFSTRSNKPMAGFGKLKRELDAAAGVTGWRLHDLRRTVATRMGEIGVQRFIVERVLNHAETSVTGRHYDHGEYLEQKRDALYRWSEYLEELVKQQNSVKK